MNKFLMGGLIVLSFISIKATAQNSINSPYSYYGIGEFSATDNSHNAGMGGLGIGVKSKGFINYSNPASYSSIDSLNFIFDFAFGGTISQFKSSSKGYNTANGNFKKIAIGFRVNPQWALSLGIVPYTNVGYKVNTNKWVEGLSESFNIVSEGNGGLSKIFMGNSFKLSDLVSLGVNTNLLIGYIEKSETYTYIEESTNYWVKRQKYRPKTAISFDFGLQLNDSINSKWQYTLGFIGGLNTKLKMKEYIVYESGESNYDEEEYLSNYDFWLPAFAGVGLSLNSSKWTLGLDYKVQYWNSVGLKNEMNWQNNSHHLAFGTQYTPKGVLGKSIFQRMSYQIGAHFDRSYLRVNSQNFDIYGITAGVLIPIRNQMSSIGISVDAGKKGRISNGMFKENYIQLNLSINLSDIWFQTRRFN